MKEKKKILIAGSGHGDIPLIVAAQNLGFYVITTGNQPDGPNGLGIEYSDEYYCEDYSNKERMLELAKKLEIDAICPCTNDFSAISTAYVAEKLDLPGHDSYETTLKLHHKDQFRQFALENNIPSPFAKSYNNIKNALNSINKYEFPLIVKPIDMSGGKGVSKITSKTEYKKAVKDAFSISRANRIVIEEYVEGTQHSFSAFLRDGKVVFHYGDNEYSHWNPYFVSTSSTPALVSEKVNKRLIEISEKISTLLSLSTGVFHIQYLLTDNGLKIIEITRRCPGDLYTYPVNYSTGIDYAKWIVKAAAGMDCSELNYSPSKRKGYFIRHCVMSPESGKVTDIIFDKSIKDKIIEKFMWWEKGDLIENVMTTKLGIVFFQFDSLEEMKDKTRKINELIKVQLK